MPEAVLVSALRTPIGTAGSGTLRDTTAFDLADHVVRAAAEGLDPEQIDDVILAEGLYGGGVIARHAAITAGLTAAGGLALNRHCAAGLGAVATRGRQHPGRHGRADHRRRRQLGVHLPAEQDPGGRRVGGLDVPDPPRPPRRAQRDMSITVGWNSAVKAGVSREDMDAWALRSHQYAIRAIDEGRFKEEIAGIETPHGMFEVDEHPRRDTSMEKLAKLKVLHPEIDGFSITAGNACGANDGAAALVMASDRLGLPALAYVRSWASVGIDPKYTGLAPVQAIPKALKRAGLTIDQVGLFEINEAFAAQVVANIRLLELDQEKVNVSGSGCSLGHPVAATGARMLVTLVHELRRRGGGIGVAAMCAGGGMGSAAVIEVPAP